MLGRYNFKEVSMTGETYPRERVVGDDDSEEERESVKTPLSEKDVNGLGK